MAFYGDATKAENLAGVTTLLDEIQDMVNAQIDSGIYPDGFGSTLNATEFHNIDKRGQKTLVLRKAPVISFTTLTDDAQSDSPIVVDTKNYTVDSETGTVYLHNRNPSVPALPKEAVDSFTVAPQSVKAEYTYGYPTVPSIIRDLATYMAAAMARQRSEANFVEGEMTTKRIQMGDYIESFDVSMLAARAEFGEVMMRLWKQAIRIYRVTV